MRELYSIALGLLLPTALIGTAAFGGIFLMLMLGPDFIEEALGVQDPLFLSAANMVHWFIHFGLAIVIAVAGYCFLSKIARAG